MSPAGGQSNERTHSLLASVAHCVAGRERKRGALVPYLVEQQDGDLRRDGQRILIQRSGDRSDEDICSSGSGRQTKGVDLLMLRKARWRVEYGAKRLGNKIRTTDQSLVSQERQETERDQGRGGEGDKRGDDTHKDFKWFSILHQSDRKRTGGGGRGMREGESRDRTAKKEKRGGRRGPPAC